MKRSAIALLFVIASTACRTLGALVSEPLPEGARVKRDLAYSPVGSDPDRRLLDLYIPKKPGPLPVVVFVHGGYWQVGGRRETFGVYVRLAHRLVARDIIAVIVGYRLAPSHRFPAQIEDVARAVASTLRNIEKFGGDPRRVFLVGHSAGGHLVSLVTQDPRWLAPYRVRPTAFAGVVSISGIYDVGDLARDSEYGYGNVTNVFGKNEETWRRASPVEWVGKHKIPRLLLAVGDDDPPVLARQHDAMAAKLQAAGVPHEAVEIADRNHAEIVTEFLSEGDDLGERVLKFVLDPSR